MTSQNAILEEIVKQNEETANRICQLTSGYIVINNRQEFPLKSSYENATTQGVIKNVAGSLVAAARSCVRDLDPFDDLAFLRIKTKNFEYLVAAEKDFTIIVQQNN